MCYNWLRRHWRVLSVLCAMCLFIKVIFSGNAISVLQFISGLTPFVKFGNLNCDSCGQSTRFLWGVYSLRGRRAYQEDRYAVYNSSHVVSYAVYDGHGGDSCSSKAANLLLKDIFQELNVCKQNCEVSRIVRENILKFDKKIVESHEKSSDQSGKLCTISQN